MQLLRTSIRDGRHRVGTIRRDDSAGDGYLIGISKQVEVVRASPRQTTAAVGSRRSLLPTTRNLVVLW